MIGIKHVSKRTGAAAIGLAVALFGAACASSAPSASGGASAAAPQQLSVSLKEFAITPSTIQAEVGVPLQIAVTNQGGAPHALAIDTGTKTIQTAQLDPGASATLDVPALTAGSYQAWCPVPGHKEAGMTAALVVGAAGSGQAADTMPGMSGSMSNMSAAQMAKLHEQSTKAFPAKTEGLGNQPLAPTMENGWKVFHLVAQEIKWEVAPNQFVQAFAYNGMVPGPEIHVRSGDRIRVVLQNELTQPTTLHFHGVSLPNAMDGVPYITQPPIMPGEAFTYSFKVVDQPGTYVYHAHFNSAEQVGRGLYGALIVDPTGKPKWDVSYTEFLGDGPLGYNINGKGFPATAPLTAKLGQTVLIRMIDEGQLVHTMHLHGFHFAIVARDGFPVRFPEMADTLSIAPGEVYDVQVTADNPGVWAFHCHVLGHAEGPQGMFGMVTALIVS
jgi:FtsP/CotA-like multicopper oxidase with cupredoxin domain